MATATINIDQVLEPGDQFMDFRGDVWIFRSVTRLPRFGRSGKVSVIDLRDGSRRDFYDSVFPGLVITED